MEGEEFWETKANSYQPNDADVQHRSTWLRLIAEGEAYCSKAINGDKSQCQD